MQVDLYNANDVRMQYFVHSGDSISIYENVPGQMAIHVPGQQHPSVYYPAKGKWMLEVRP